MISIGLFISLFSLAVLMYTGNLLSDSEDVKRRFHDLEKTTPNLSKKEQDELNYFKINRVVKNLSWICFFTGFCISSIGLLIN
jgi:hypothetical protein